MASWKEMERNPGEAQSGVNKISRSQRDSGLKCWCKDVLPAELPGNSYLHPNALKYTPLDCVETIFLTSFEFAQHFKFPSIITHCL